MSPRRTNRRRGQAPAIALAALGHLLALFALGWRAPRLAEPEPADDHAAAIEVTLVRPEVPRRASRAATASPRPSPAPSARVLIAPTPGAPIMGAPDQAPPATSPPQSDANLDSQPLRDALRGGVGCADPAAYHLNREERAGCNQRLAAAKPAAVGSQFSAMELAQFDAENKYDPILVRKPHNGCLPRVGDRPAAPGGPSRPARSAASTTFGLNCAWSF